MYTIYSIIYNILSLYYTSFAHCTIQYHIYTTYMYSAHLVHSTDCTVEYHIQHTVLYIFAQYNCTAHTVSILYYINAAYCKLRLLTFCIAIVY